MKDHSAYYGTVDYWFQEFLNHGGLKNSSKPSYKNRYNRYIQPCFGEQEWERLQRKDLVPFWRELYETGLSDSSVKKIYDLWSALRNYVERMTGKPSFFLDETAVRKEKYQIPPGVSVEIMKCILYSDGAESTILLLALGYFTGLKLKEALGIRTYDWNQKEGCVTIASRTRAFEVREVPFPALLNRYYERVLSGQDRQRHPSEWLFADAEGRQWTQSRAAHRISKLLQQEGLPAYLTYEAFRSAFAGKAEEGGLHRNTTEKMMGICSARTRRWDTSCSYELQAEIAEVPWKKYRMLTGH